MSYGKKLRNVLIIFSVVVLIGLVLWILFIFSKTPKYKDVSIETHIATSTTLITDDQQVALTGIKTLGNALAYYPEHKSFVGFVDATSTVIAACSGKPIINISPDGQAIASFGKLCSTPKQYFCVSVDVSKHKVDQGTVVSDSYALGDHVTCE